MLDDHDMSFLDTRFALAKMYHPCKCSYLPLIIESNNFLPSWVPSSAIVHSPDGMSCLVNVHYQIIENISKPG